MYTIKLIIDNIFISSFTSFVHAQEVSETLSMYNNLLAQEFEPRSGSGQAGRGSLNMCRIKGRHCGERQQQRRVGVVESSVEGCSRAMLSHMDAHHTAHPKERKDDCDLQPYSVYKGGGSKLWERMWLSVRQYAKYCFNAGVSDRVSRLILRPSKH